MKIPVDRGLLQYSKCIHLKSKCTSTCLYPEIKAAPTVRRHGTNGTTKATFITVQDTKLVSPDIPHQKTSQNREPLQTGLFPQSQGGPV